MATPIQIDELDPVTSLSAAAAVAIVQGNDTLRTTPAAFINDARSYTPAGTGGIAEPVETALRRFVHSGQYSSTPNYETARAALSGTTGLANLAVTGTVSIEGALVLTGTASGVVAATLIDAKGDLLAGSAADTIAKLAAGTDEHRLVADSAQSTGLKYVPDTTNYAIGAKGDVLVGTAADTVAAKSIGSDGSVFVADSSQADGWRAFSPFRGLLAGLTLSNNGSDATNDIDIAAGGAMSNDNSYYARLSSALTKQLDAAWAVGTNAGMRATGVVIANGTYHIFLIARPDSGVVDIAADTSVTGANIAANTNVAYTKKRRIGSILRESGAIVAFKQVDDVFMRSTAVNDIAATDPGTSAVTATLSVPVGAVVEVIFTVGIDPASSAATSAYVSSLDVSDQVPTISGPANVGTSIDATHVNHSGTFRVRTNTSAQVRYRISHSGAGQLIRIWTYGWVDTRGRND